MIGAAHLARLAAELEMGGNKEAATPVVLKDLLHACSELERMLLAGKFASTQGPPMTTSTIAATPKNSNDRLHQIRIVIADDHPVVRIGVRNMLQSDAGLEVIG